MSESPLSVGEKTAVQPVKEYSGLLDVSVLVVDDVADNLDLIEELLEDHVWNIVRAQSGEEAVRLAVERPPDMVLLDLMMPGMSGLAVLRAFRSNKTLKNTPVIFQTAHADKDNIITARRLGCDSFLCKPLTRGRLLSEMSKCLESRSRGSVGDDEKPDDSTMPEMDGYELCQRLREMSHARKIPVLFLTAHRTSVADAVQGFDIGGCDYITKPFEADELRARVRAVFRAQGEHNQDIGDAKTLTRRLLG